MSKFIDLTGKRFNRLTVVRRVENAPKGIAQWLCRCDCGNETIVRGNNLKSGAVKSCGCLKHIGTSTTHGMSKTKIYRVWQGIRNRCYNKNNKMYQDYGGRGITMCDEWKNSFESFYEWAMTTGYMENLTIERIDNDGDYCQKNCIWTDRKAQSNNRRNCKRFSYNGETKTIAQWCDCLGVDYKRVHNRITKLGWDFEKAITCPVDENKRNMETRKRKNG